MFSGWRYIKLWGFEGFKNRQFLKGTCIIFCGILSEVEESIVNGQWRADQLFAEAEARH